MPSLLLALAFLWLALASLGSGLYLILTMP